MAISGVNGSQGPQESNNNLPVKKNDKQDNTAEIDKKIREYFNSATSMENDKNKIDSEKESTFFNNAINILRNQFPGAANIIDNIVDKLTGDNKTNAVKEATNAPVKEEQTNFDENGNPITNIKRNPDGSTDMNLDGEHAHGTDISVFVTGPGGEPVGGTKVLPNGMQALIQSNGKVDVYDPKTGEFLPEDKAKEILAQFQ